MASQVIGLRRMIVAGLAVWFAAFPWVNGGAEAAFPAALATEQPFLIENQVAMDRMMLAMAIKPSGEADEDFAAMMIPHHQGAIEMAQAELLHGHNEQLRRIAQEIIVEQQQEIDAMRLALGQPAPPSAPAPDQIIPQSALTLNLRKATP